MARYCGPVCRLCRREGQKLFLKGERCYTNKCAVERREGGPGQHGKGRKSFSDFKVQLRAKQLAKFFYGVSEKIFRKYFEKAARKKGVTGTGLLVNLESRLDNVVHRIGYGASRRQARQVVSHGHVLVNGKKVNVASYQVGVGDTIEITENSKGKLVFQNATGTNVPEWLTLDKSAMRAFVNRTPTREECPSGIQEQLIVELYSK